MSPVHPVGQIHVYEPGVLIQVPPFRHCNIPRHSLISCAQLGPVQPGAHVHV